MKRTEQELKKRRVSTIRIGEELNRISKNRKKSKEESEPVTASALAPMILIFSDYCDFIINLHGIDMPVVDDGNLFDLAESEAFFKLGEGLYLHNHCVMAIDFERMIVIVNEVWFARVKKIVRSDYVLAKLDALREEHESFWRIDPAFLPGILKALEGMTINDQ